MICLKKCPYMKIKLRHEEKMTDIFKDRLYAKR